MQFCGEYSVIHFHSIKYQDISLVSDFFSHFFSSCIFFSIFASCVVFCSSITASFDVKKNFYYLARMIGSEMEGRLTLLLAGHICQPHPGQCVE